MFLRLDREQYSDSALVVFEEFKKTLDATCNETWFLIANLMCDQKFFAVSEHVPVADVDCLWCVRMKLFLDEPVRGTHIVDM